jgi:hypothetical protein
MHEHGSLPRARQYGLLEETVGEELLLYDESSHTGHCLSPIAAGVWRHCDGERDVTELAELTGASESLVADAVYELRGKDLLDAEPTLIQSTASGISRRDAIVRVARVGAAAAAVPLIVSATAATPAMASSGVCKNCNTESTCCVAQTGSTCCCCEDGVAVTITTGGEFTCNAECTAGKHGNVFKEASNMKAA